MKGWIPVSERLPENDNRVLVFNRELAVYDTREGAASPGVRIGRKIMNGHLRPDDSIGVDDTTTHWMPLPEPPKEVEL